MTSIVLPNIQAGSPKCICHCTQRALMPIRLHDWNLALVRQSKRKYLLSFGQCPPVAEAYIDNRLHVPSRTLEFVSATMGYFCLKMDISLYFVGSSWRWGLSFDFWKTLHYNKHQSTGSQRTYYETWPLMSILCSLTWTAQMNMNTKAKLVRPSNIKLIEKWSNSPWRDWRQPEGTGKDTWPVLSSNFMILPLVSTTQHIQVGLDHGC